MQRPADVPTILLARVIDGQTELVEWIRQADTVWIVTESEEIVIGPDAWTQAWADLVARGFVEVSPNIANSTIQPLRQRSPITAPPSPSGSIVGGHRRTYEGLACAATGRGDVGA
jgi:hypothetical protein